MFDIVSLINLALFIHLKIKSTMDLQLFVKKVYGVNMSLYYKLIK